MNFTAIDVLLAILGPLALCGIKNGYLYLGAVAIYATILGYLRVVYGSRN